MVVKFLEEWIYRMVEWEAERRVTQQGDIYDADRGKDID